MLEILTYIQSDKHVWRWGTARTDMAITAINDDDDDDDVVERLPAYLRWLSIYLFKVIYLLACLCSSLPKYPGWRPGAGLSKCLEWRDR